MKNYVICFFIGVVGMLIYLVVNDDKNESGDSYPIVYYYGEKSYDGNVKNKYVLNKDKTAKIIYEYTWNGTQKVYDTYWQEGSDGSYWIKSDLYGFEVIKEGKVYMSVDDAKSKRGGTSLMRE